MALRKLWLMLLNLGLVQLGLLVNDIMSYFTPNCAVLIQSSRFGSDLFWFFMRSIGYQFWAIPIIYVFWSEKEEKLVEKANKLLIKDVAVSDKEASIN